APYPMQHGDGGYAYGTAWMDAGVIVPWTVWRAYGDTEVIRRHWLAMTRFLEFRMAQSPDLRGSNRFNPWGDWLPIGSTTPVEYIDAVYFAYSATLMAQMANAIGKPVDAKRYSDLSDRIRDRFREDYVKGDGTLKVETQTAYALALAHGMVSGSEQTVAERLVKMIGDSGYRMTTRFLGTYPLLPVLSESGHHHLGGVEQLHQAQAFFRPRHEFLQPLRVRRGFRVDVLPAGGNPRRQPGLPADRNRPGTAIAGLQPRPAAHRLGQRLVPLDPRDDFGPLETRRQRVPS